MSKTEDFLNMLYWILGIIIIIFIIDWFWYRPHVDIGKTEILANKLREKNDEFYQIYGRGKFSIDRGIVMVIDSNQIVSGALLITSLRHIGCNLPIIVYHLEPEALEPHPQNFIAGIKGVLVKDLKQLSIDGLRQDTAKIYALLHAPFKNVLLVNPDLLFLRNPEYLFNDTRYVTTGALLWKDRKIQRYWDKKVYTWVNRLIPYRTGDNRILDKQAGNYQSDSILLINKEKHITTLEKLWVITKNNELVYRYLPGAKETFWIAAELAKKDYVFVMSYPGVIGELKTGLVPNSLCGHLLYFDVDGFPLCWDGSVFERSGITEFTHYSLFYPDSEWNTALTNCLKSKIYTPIPNDAKQLINDYLRILHEINENLVDPDTE